MAKKPTYEELEQRVKELEEENREVNRQNITSRKQAEEAMLANEAQKKAILDGITINLAFVNKDLELLWANKAAADSVCKTPDAMIGRKCYELWADPLKPCEGCPTLKAFKTKKTEQTIMHTPDGKVWEEKGEPVFDGKGELIGVLEIAHDITAKAQVEKSLKESEEKYSKLFHSNPQWLHISTLEDGRYVEVNEATKEITGYERDELIGRTSKELGLWADYEERSRLVKVAKEQGGFREQEVAFIKKNGEPVSLLWSAAIIEIMGTAYFINSVADITERKQAEEALRESEKQLSIRNRIAEIFLTTPDDELYGEVLQIVLKSMESPYGTFAYIDEDGDRIVPSMTRDIWDECKMPEKGIFFPRDTWGNTLWARCLIEKKSFFSNGPFKIPDGHMPIRRALATPIVHKGESIGNLMVGDKPTDYSEKDKELLEAIADRIAPILHARLLNERNERERNRAEEENAALESKLHRAQKMEAMGLMAGGVAHDLNNILSGIVSYPELLLMDLPEDSPLRNPMKTIQESGMRAVDVVADLMTIARGVATGKEISNLNTLIEGYLTSAEHQKLAETHPSITFKTEIDSDLLNISCSPTHIKKILMNLITNASEAVEGSGIVAISVLNRYLDEPLKSYEDVRTGEYVVLTISDNGSGISPGDMERIFEPFYTKKVMGRSGTGLGLAVVWNTVQDHKGYINVESSEKGTVFELYFPVTRKEVSDEKAKIPLENYLGHGEKILVVDDEERQRVIACGMLTKLDYTAEAVSSGEEAIKYMKENTVDLIVLDMVMPKGINGRETYQQIIKIRPGQKAIIASGYAKTKEVDIAQELGAGKYIKKPYTLEKIGVAVKKELEK